MPVHPYVCLMKTNIVIDISTPIPYLTKFWVSHYGPKCYQPMKLQVSLKCDISKKWMNFIFSIQINIKVFYKLILPFWLCITWHAQSTQNKFVYLCSYLMLFPEKHAVWNWFFACKKNQKCSTNWLYHFGCTWPDMPKVPKTTSFQYLCNISRKM